MFLSKNVCAGVRHRGVEFFSALSSKCSSSGGGAQKPNRDYQQLSASRRGGVVDRYLNEVQLRQQNFVRDLSLQRNRRLEIAQALCERRDSRSSNVLFDMERPLRSTSSNKREQAISDSNAMKTHEQATLRSTDFLKSLVVEGSEISCAVTHCTKKEARRILDLFESPHNVRVFERAGVDAEDIKIIKTIACKSLLSDSSLNRLLMRHEARCSAEGNT